MLNAKAESVPTWPDRALPVLHHLTAVPPTTDYLFDGLALVAGTVGVMIAQGDTGKTTAALEIAIAVALAGTQPTFDPLGIGPRGASAGAANRVVYYCTEDPDIQLHQRIQAATREVEANQLPIAAANLDLRTLCGAARSLDISDEGDQTHIIETCRGARLIVIDTLSRFHSKDENSNPEMMLVVAGAERIATATGAAVMLVHHLGKATANGAQTASALDARGASVIVENTRWCLHLRRNAERGDVEMREVKHNYGRGCEPFQCRWFGRVLKRYATGLPESERRVRTPRSGGQRNGLY